MIDEGLPEPWPPEVLEALARFKQGHLVERPPIFYAASPAHGIWDLTRGAGVADAEEDLLELSDEDRPSYGLITTQTCDIAEEGRPDHPWVEVVPVYRLVDVSDEERELLESHRRSHLVLLEPPDLDDGPWVADLRIEVPIEKSWLVGRTPVDSFSSEEKYQVLAQRLAAKRERPALATPAMDTIVRPLANWLRRGGGLKAAAMVDELRLARRPPPGRGRARPRSGSRPRELEVVTLKVGRCLQDERPEVTVGSPAIRLTPTRVGRPCFASCEGRRAVSPAIRRWSEAPRPRSGRRPSPHERGGLAAA